MAVKTLSELHIEAELARKELNMAILDDSFSGMQSAKEKMDKAIKEYNQQAILADFRTLYSKSNPIKEAIEQLNTATITAKATKDKDTDVVTYTIESSVKQIDLVAFDDYCEGTMACDKMWRFKVEKLCLLVTYRVAKLLGQDTKKLEDTYYISSIAHQVEMGKTPMSNNQILAQVQNIVDAIIFEIDNGKNEYKVTSHDVAYIVQTMTKRGKSGVVVTPKASTMHTLIMDVLHRIVTNGDYKVEYITKKQAKEATTEVTNPIGGEIIGNIQGRIVVEGEQIDECASAASDGNAAE